MAKDLKKDKKTADKTEKSQVEKENQDFENIQSADKVIDTTEPAKKEIDKSSKNTKDGKTDNTEENS